jgi:hypothetical protein
MLLLNKYFKNYAEFKEKFGKINDGTGRRNNKLFLEAMKHGLKSGNKESFLSYNYQISNDFLIGYCYVSLREKYHSYDTRHRFYILDKLYRSNKFTLDNLGGLCEDGDSNSIRYVNVESGKVYKMRAGKFIRALFVESGADLVVGEKLLNYYCEVFAQNWKAHSIEKFNVDSRLVVDDDFESIYDRDNYIPDTNYNSCMTNKGHHTMYEQLGNCKAARILNSDGLILSRCIVWTNVQEINGEKTWRLADRQYSSDGNLVYSQLLINALIKEGFIDGYKKIGAGCGDSNAYISVSGEDLSEKGFFIDCDLTYGDTVSYMDTFKWYYMDDGFACNKPGGCGVCISLDTTSGEIEDNRNYDEYNDEYTSDDLVDILSWTGVRYRQMVTASEFAGDNFLWSKRHDIYLTEAYYSDILDDYLRFDEWEEIEDDYKRCNWNYDEYNDEYTEEDVIVCKIWNGSEYIDQYVSENYALERFEEVDGVYYSDIFKEEVLG